MEYFDLRDNAKLRELRTIDIVWAGEEFLRKGNASKKLGKICKWQNHIDPM